MKRIAIFLLAILIVGSVGSCADSNVNDTVDASDASNSNQADTAVQPFDVTISVENIAADEKPVFRIKSNLPDETELLLTLENTSGFKAQDNVILQNCQGTSRVFSEQGNALEGNYTLRVTTGMPSLQEQSVQDVIGSKGEYMTGNLIKECSMAGDTYNSIEAEFSFNIDPNDSIGIEAPKELIDYPDYPSVLDFGAYSGISEERQNGHYFIYNDYDKTILQDYIDEMKNKGFMYGTSGISGNEFILLGNPQYVLMIAEEDTFVLFSILENDGTLDPYFENSDYTMQIQDDSDFTPSDSTVTMGKRNALESAKQYISVMAFSYSGLIEQLEYEGYSNSEATYAADNCGADWYEQAALSAKEYLGVMSFSRQGLIEQLEYEGFTYDQAVYGVEKCGY